MHTTTQTSAIALIIGPVLLAAASVAWLADQGELRGILTFWAMIALAIGLHGILLRRLHRPAPALHSVLTVLLTVGIAAGVGFAVELAMTEVLDVDRLVDAGQPSSVLLLQLPGLMFPLSVLAIAGVSWRYRTLGAVPAALLALAAVSFPISRIGEVAGLALASDTLLAAAVIPLATQVMANRSNVTPELGHDRVL